MDTRAKALAQWSAEQLQQPLDSFVTVSGDASFRRYFRATSAGRSWIAVDAPVQSEDCRPFVTVAQALQEQGLQVPEVYQVDYAQGWMLLRDLGDQLYFPALTEARADALYQSAIAALVQMQPCRLALPSYDRNLLLKEMRLFPQWYLTQYLEIKMDQEQESLLETCFALLVDNALVQPRVFVHRDYHSRNLMLQPEQAAPGVIDFQDAVRGPITYDLVSLLKDAYISWPQTQVVRWALGYRDLAQQRGLLGECDDGKFMRWFDLMGLQRHLKVVGIFARLHLRDGKSGYLQDIPRVLAYIMDTCQRYREFAPLGHWLSQVLPAPDETA